jgi:hypothetical protein
MAHNTVGPDPGCIGIWPDDYRGPSGGKMVYGHRVGVDRTASRVIEVGVIGVKAVEHDPSEARV